MDSLEKIIREKVDRLESVPNKFANTVGNSQKQIFQELLTLFEGIERKDGLIILSNSNFSKIEQIADKLRKAVFDSDYKPALQQFMNEYNTQAEITNKFFLKSFSDFEPTQLYKNVLRSSQKKTLELLGEEAIAQNFIDPIKEILSTSVTTGQSFPDAVKSLRAYIEGNPELEGGLERYVKQVAKDSFSFSDRQYTQTISNDLEMEWYVYRGGIVEGTRYFCREYNGKYFHKKEIEDFGNGIDIDGSDLTQEELRGRIEGTDSASIFIYCGGYNCFHSWLPVSIELVPREVVERNISKGYYQA